MSKLLSKVLEIIIALTALAGIGLTVAGFNTGGKFLKETLAAINLLFFFTMDSSLFVLLFFILRIFTKTPNGKYSGSIVLTGLITINILITGIVFMILLRGFEVFFGPILFAGNILLHYILPPLCLVYFLIFSTRKKLKFTGILYWLVFPVVYFIIILIRGAITKTYPYPFVDVHRLGYIKVFINSFFVLIFIIILGLVLVALNRAARKLYPVKE